MAEASEKLVESQEALKIMANDDFKSDLATFLRSMYPLLYVKTNEERRYMQFMEHFCKVHGYECFIWNCYEGLVNLQTREKTGNTDNVLNSPEGILEYIITEANSLVNNPTAVENKKKNKIRGYIYILLDFHHFVQDVPEIERRLRSLGNIESIYATIITGPLYKTTPVLENLIPAIEFPRPNREEIKNALWQIVNATSKILTNICDETKEIEEELINSTSGLSLGEAQTAFAKSLVRYKKWNIQSILQEKKQIIRKSGILDFYDKVVPLEEVGGLKNLVNWIKDRKDCFSKEAEEYGLKKPRGLLTIGASGCGKSLMCKAIASSWNMPLLKLDFGKLFGSHVGDSEKNAREAIALAESVSPCILWIDEIEKAISGVRSSGQTDGGTTSRVLSTFLTWMQEKTAPVLLSLPLMTMKVFQLNS